MLSQAMKKFLVAILALLYLTTSTGATVHMHYCMGKLVDWGFAHSKNDSCENCGMSKKNEKNKGCCKDEHKQVKLEQDQKITQATVEVMQLGVAVIPQLFYQPDTPCFTSITEENPVSNAPPRSSSVAVYILNRTFLI